MSTDFYRLCTVNMKKSLMFPKSLPTACTSYSIMWCDF